MSSSTTNNAEIDLFSLCVKVKGLFVARLDGGGIIKKIKRKKPNNLIS